MTVQSADYTVVRKVHKIGGSLVVALPKIWTVAVGLKAKDAVEVHFDGDGAVRVMPLVTLKSRG